MIGTNIFLPFVTRKWGDLKSGISIQNTEGSSSSVTLDIYKITQAPTSTSTPIPTLTPTDDVCELSFDIAQLTCYEGECSSGNDCSGDLACKDIDGNKLCVNPNCSSEEDCVCPDPICWDQCDDDSQCPSSLRCEEVDGTKRCVNSNCKEEDDCECAIGCWDECSNDNQCPSSLRCEEVDGSKRCVNSSCKEESDCNCPTATPTPTTTPTPEAPKAPELPKAGGVPPTILFTIGGIVLVAIGLLL